MAYDDWAFEDMSNRDWVDGAQTIVVDDRDYNEMHRAERERMENYLPEPCNHIDYPCCGCGPDPLGNAIVFESKKHFLINALETSGSHKPNTNCCHENSS